MATINMHMKFEIEIPKQTWLMLRKPCRLQTDGQTDRRTDKVNPVYPPSNFVGRGYKNKLYRKSLKIKSTNNEMVYKIYRNKLKHLLKSAEKKYYSDLVLMNKSNSKKMWSIIKNIINRNKRKYINSRFKLSDGSITNDKQLMSDKFNDFFINVGPNLAKRIEKQNKNPEQFMKAKVTFSLYLEPVTEQEIYKIVSSLKNSSPGYDNLSPSILQLSLSLICPLLTHICNLSLSEGIFPDEFKLANVIPIFKSGDHELSIITDQYLSYVPYLRFLRKLCIVGYLIILIITIFYFLINLGSESLIQHIWHSWFLSTN